MNSKNPVKKESAITVIPTILANTKQELDENLVKVLPVSKTLQIDFMDGHFVPSKGVDIEDIPDLTRWSSWTFEAHLMMYHPEKWFEEAAKKGFKRVIFHYEAVEDKNIAKIAQQIRDLKMMPVLAINPDTPPIRILKYTQFVDGILFLGVHPGFNGAPYVTTTPQRIKEFIEDIKEKDKKIINTKLKNNSSNKKILSKSKLFIQVDGGIGPDTIAQVIRAGATRVNSGSYIRNAQDPSKAIAALYEIVNPTSSKKIISIEKTITKQNTKKSNKKKNIRTSLNIIKKRLTKLKL